MLTKTIFLGADHAGFALKEKIKKKLTQQKMAFIDLGNKKLKLRDDYPDYAARVARKVARLKGIGILICGSGQGVCIVANKIKGIRAALAEHIKDAYLARKDDDCNILCLQGRGTNATKAMRIVQTFLETNFSTIDRYNSRINKIKKLEKTQWPR